MQLVMDSDRVHVQDLGTWVEIHSSWPHWICLFPQHGRGRKHERWIVLADWQSEVVDSESTELVRGLLHSDGTRHMNAVVRPLSAGNRRYQYPRYQFKNNSADIRSIFTAAIDRLGIAWTQAGPTTISIARRESVARLDEFVGPKR
jgi:hypothetical protein